MLINKKTDIAESFNRYYIDLADKLSETASKPTAVSSPGAYQPTNSTKNCLFLSPVTANEIEKLF